MTASETGRRWLSGWVSLLGASGGSVTAAAARRMSSFIPLLKVLTIGYLKLKKA